MGNNKSNWSSLINHIFTFRKGNLFPEKKLIIEPSQPSQTTVSSLEQSTQTLASSPGTSSGRSTCYHSFHTVVCHKRNYYHKNHFLLDCQLNYSNEASIDQAALKLTSSEGKLHMQLKFICLLNSRNKPVYICPSTK